MKASGIRSRVVSKRGHAGIEWFSEGDVTIAFQEDEKVRNLSGL